MALALACAIAATADGTFYVCPPVRSAVGMVPVRTAPATSAADVAAPQNATAAADRAAPIPSSRGAFSPTSRDARAQQLQSAGDARNDVVAAPFAVAIWSRGGIFDACATATVLNASLTAADRAVVGGLWYLSLLASLAVVEGALNPGNAGGDVGDLLTGPVPMTTRATRVHTRTAFEWAAYAPPSGADAPDASASAGGAGANRSGGGRGAFVTFSMCNNFPRSHAQCQTPPPPGQGGVMPNLMRGDMSGTGAPRIDGFATAQALAIIGVFSVAAVILLASSDLLIPPAGQNRTLERIRRWNTPKPAPAGGFVPRPLFGLAAVIAIAFTVSSWAVPLSQTTVFAPSTPITGDAGARLLPPVIRAECELEANLHTALLAVFVAAGVYTNLSAAAVGLTVAALPGGGGMGMPNAAVPPTVQQPTGASAIANATPQVTIGAAFTPPPPPPLLSIVNAYRERALALLSTNLAPPEAPAPGARQVLFSAYTTLPFRLSDAIAAPCEQGPAMWLWLCAWLLVVIGPVLYCVVAAVNALLRRRRYGDDGADSDTPYSLGGLVKWGVGQFLPSLMPFIGGGGGGGGADKSDAKPPDSSPPVAPPPPPAPTSPSDRNADRRVRARRHGSDTEWSARPYSSPSGDSTASDSDAGRESPPHRSAQRRTPRRRDAGEGNEGRPHPHGDNRGASPHLPRRRDSAHNGGARQPTSNRARHQASGANDSPPARSHRSDGGGPQGSAIDALAAAARKWLRNTAQRGDRGIPRRDRSPPQEHAPGASKRPPAHAPPRESVRDAESGGTLQAIARRAAARWLEDDGLPRDAAASVLDAAAEVLSGRGRRRKEI